MGGWGGAAAAISKVCTQRRVLWRYSFPALRSLFGEYDVSESGELHVLEFESFLRDQYRLEKAREGREDDGHSFPVVMIDTLWPAETPRRMPSPVLSRCASVASASERRLGFIL